MLIGNVNTEEDDIAPYSHAGPGSLAAGGLTGGSRWCVLHTRARNEKQVAALLKNHEQPHYLPLVEVRHVYQKSQVTFQVPLFPGYVFAGDEMQVREINRRTQRVANIISVKDQDRLLGELRQIDQALSSGATMELFPGLKPGTRCRVIDGPMVGLEGTVDRTGQRCKLYLAVSILGQSAAIEVPAMLLEPLS